MATPALFVGVVSHEGSRFSVSQGPEGLAARLAAALPDVEVAINTADLLESGSPWVGARQVQASLSAELDVDRRWARFLGRSTSARWWATYTVRRARRAWQRLKPPPEAMLRRLLNIELSHLDLLRRGLDSGAPWVLILEDDAFSTDIADISTGLAGLMGTPERPAYVNLSVSFTPEELGIDHLLRPAPDLSWQGALPRSILRADLPVTNTVCAILYSAEFLRILIPALDALPMEPVVPIDWKLNEALMAIHRAGLLPAGSCWLVEPGPIDQMSMRPAAILPS